MRNGSCALTLQGHSDTVTCAVFVGDGRRVVTASNDTALKVWDIRCGSNGTALATLRGHRNWVRCCDVYGELVVSCGKYCTVHTWALS